MLSTTEPQPERGQSLVIFALALPVLLGFAALAFDLGQIQLDRRSEQNAADAAALAGARYIASDVPKAKDEAMRIAYQNGLGAGSTYASSGLTNPANSSKVTVSVPPGPESAFAGRTGYIEVQIGIKRSSLFA